jgi:protoheme IX farnesyltransferase
MHQKELSVRFATRWRFTIITLAVLAYLLNLVGVAWTTAFGDALSSIALLILGIAVSQLTLAQLAAAPQWAGKRAPAVWRRGRHLAFATGITLYLGLVFGALVTNANGLAACTTWPLCAPAGAAAIFALVHRGVAATATLLVILLAIWVLRSHSEQGLKRAARWAIGFIVAQNLVGLLMVMAAQGYITVPLSYARFAHLAVGALTWSSVMVLATMAVRVPPLMSGSPIDRSKVPSAKAERQPTLWQDYVSLTKPRVITLLIFTTFVALFITPAGVPSWSIIFWTMIGGWLMPAGAQAINCYFDGDIDAKMGRTSRRPIPSGRIPGWHALALGLALGALAFAVLALFVNLLTAWVALGGYIYYAVLYTIVLKRHSVHNIVIGGGAGAVPPLVGWAAATGSLSWAALLLFAIIFYWTPPHFWALALIRKKDYANAGVPMLPVVSGDQETKRQILVYTMIMVILSLLPTPIGMMGIAYLVAAAALGLAFIAYVVRMMGNDTATTRWALYRFSLLYLFLLFMAMMVDRLTFG